MHDTPQHGSFTATPSTSTLISASASASDQGHRSVPHDRMRRALKFHAYLGLAALFAILVPLAVVAATHLTVDGLARAFIAWLIAILSGLSVYASAAATQFGHGTR